MSYNGPNGNLGFDTAYSSMARMTFDDAITMGTNTINFMHSLHTGDIDFDHSMLDGFD